MHEQRQRRRWRRSDSPAGFGDGERRRQGSGMFFRRRRRRCGCRGSFFLSFSSFPFRRFPRPSHFPPSSPLARPLPTTKKQSSSISAVFLNPSSPPGGPSQLRRVRLICFFLGFLFFIFLLKPYSTRGLGAFFFFPFEFLSDLPTHRKQTPKKQSNSSLSRTTEGSTTSLHRTTEEETEEGEAGGL